MTVLVRKSGCLPDSSQSTGPLGHQQVRVDLQCTYSIHQALAAVAKSCGYGVGQTSGSDDAAAALRALHLQGSQPVHITLAKVHEMPVDDLAQLLQVRTSCPF